MADRTAPRRSGDDGNVVVGCILLYILYLDESGVHAEAKTFVLAGLAVFEREIHWFTQDVESIQQRYFPTLTDSVEFHVAQLRRPEDKIPEPFRSLTGDQRHQLVADIYQIIRKRHGVLFGVAIEKSWCHEDPYERAFEELTNRFDLFIRRYNLQSATEQREEQRGLIVVAESSYRDRLEVLGRKFRGGATRWRTIRALAEVPFFVPASNTRLLQLADFCANAIYGRYNGGFTRDFDVIAPRFDREGNRIHGLTHLCSDSECQCPGCLSRA